jgi:hypothetical protein
MAASLPCLGSDRLEVAVGDTWAWAWGVVGTGDVLAEVAGAKLACVCKAGVGALSSSRASIKLLRKSSFETSGAMYAFSVPFLGRISSCHGRGTVIY